MKVGLLALALSLVGCHACGRKEADPDPALEASSVAQDEEDLAPVECKGIRQDSLKLTFVEFYDPTLFVDPKLYARHHHGHLGAVMAQKEGALGLWMAAEVPDAAGDIIHEAIRIEPRTFEPSFWSVPEVRRWTP